MSVSSLGIRAEGEDIRVKINGEELTFDVAPIMHNRRVLVPLRTTLDSLGAENIRWNEKFKRYSVIR